MDRGRLFTVFTALITAGTVFACGALPLSHLPRVRKCPRKAGLPIIFDIDYRPYSWPSPEVAADVLSRAGEAKVT